MNNIAIVPLVSKKNWSFFKRKSKKKNDVKSLTQTEVRFVNYIGRALLAGTFYLFNDLFEVNLMERNRYLTHWKRLVKWISMRSKWFQLKADFSIRMFCSLFFSFWSAHSMSMIPKAPLLICTMRRIWNVIFWLLAIELMWK